uniref:Uncharacterized protein n=1 Tax=Anguilla anguilla TaxID=7936 RepID=A0A0E9RI89_ANGAN
MTELFRKIRQFLYHK